MFISIKLKHKTEINDIFMIILIKIKIIMVNIIKIYTRNAHFITRNMTLPKSPSKEYYTINCEQSIMTFF